MVEQSSAIFPMLGIEAAGLQGGAPVVFNLMFAVVFWMNTFFAIDAYQEAKSLGGEALRKAA